jgi:hypothetical protein
MNTEMLHIDMERDRMIFILVGYGILMWAFGFAWGRLI